MAVPSVSDVLSIPTRWGGVNNAANSLTQYFAGQQAKRQELQYNLANQLINAQALRMGYGGGQSPEIASMLNQNPYGNGLFPSGGGQGGASTPVSMPSSINVNGMFGLGGGLGGMSMGAAPSFGMGGGQSAGNASNTVSMGGQFNPLSQSGQPDNVATSATMENKPYIGMVPKSVDVQNVPAQARIAGAKSQAEANVAIPTTYAKDIVTNKAKEDTAFNSLNAMSDNLVSSLKGVLAQQGGGGPIPEAVGWTASKLGMKNTGLIKGMSAVKRDTAIAYARTLANGSQGVQKLMEKVADTLPDGGFTSEQAGSTVAEMKFTAMALKVAADKLKLTPDQIDNLSEEQLQMLVDSGKTQLGGKQAQDSIYQQVGQQFADTQPRKSIDLEGNIQDAQVNPLAGALGMKYNPLSKAGQPSAQSQGNQMPSREEIMAELQKRKASKGSK